MLGQSRGSLVFFTPLTIMQRLELEYSFSMLKNQRRAISLGTEQSSISQSDLILVATQTRIRCIQITFVS